jgi:hypothetical protein
MEKKGELLNQLAIISDLLEKMNIDSKSRTIVIEVNENEFDRVFNIVEQKYAKKLEKPKNTFNITIGGVDIIFNTSSV